jgi:hypothetical protein
MEERLKIGEKEPYGKKGITSPAKVLTISTVR